MLYTVVRALCQVNREWKIGVARTPKTEMDNGHCVDACVTQVHSIANFREKLIYH